MLDELKNPPASLACSFSNRKNRRKDGGIYSLSILQAEASGIHDGRWFGGGRCRCCQDARHRLQGRFGTCVSISVSCCHSTKILPPHAPNPWWSSGDNSVFLGNQDAIGPQNRLIISSIDIGRDISAYLAHREGLILIGISHALMACSTKNLQDHVEEVK